ncbi:hypothetical protein BZZ01_00215 [Nostocales cyanobacterium HT-58-2]|nr:hypothetical protein BZZ01_00215 [Nostocales cyanobacterium HT-58-2]
MSKWNAQDYHNQSTYQQSVGRELVTKLDLKGNERILDIGCGDGKVTAEIATHVPNGSVLGIDSSEEMISFAKEQFSPSNFPNCTFQCMNAESLNFNNEFDVIVSFFCLHWVLDHAPVLEGIKNSLKANGRTLMTFVGKPKDTDGTSNALKTIIQSQRWNEYFQDFTSPFGFYDPEEYEKLLESVGLKANRVESILTHIIYQGKEDIVRHALAIDHYLTNRIPKDLLPEFVDDLANTYIEFSQKDTTGLIYIPLRKLEVEATKVEKTSLILSVS